MGDRNLIRCHRGPVFDFDIAPVQGGETIIRRSDHFAGLPGIRQIPADRIRQPIPAANRLAGGMNL